MPPEESTPAPGASEYRSRAARAAPHACGRGWVRASAERAGVSSLLALRRAAIVLFGIAASGVVACSGSEAVPPGALTDAPAYADACVAQTAPPSPTPLPSAGARALVKAPIRGLIDLGQVSADAMHEPPYNTLYYVCERQSAISGIVVNDTWADLQPASSGQSIDTATIDAALQAVERYNRFPGRALGVRLRVWAGIDAPAWAKTIGGAPIAICDQNAVPQTSAARAAARATPTPCPAVAVRTVGRFWSDAYDDAWRALQKQLAAKYDRDPVVTEVSLSSCSSLTSEPFVQPEDGYSRANLLAAGYTDRRYQLCLSGAVARDYAAYWHDTPVDFSFNPFRRIDETPPQTDLAFTERTIDACRAEVGERCILLNETMGKFMPEPSPSPGATPALAADYFSMWQYMQRRGGGVTFQTASPPNLLAAWGTNLAGWDAAVRLASSFGAASLELFPPERSQATCLTPQGWTRGYTCFSKAVLARWKHALSN